MENETFRAIVLRHLEDFADQHAKFDAAIKPTRQDWVSIFLGANQHLNERRGKKHSLQKQTRF